MAFLRNLLASILGFFIATGIIFLVMLLFIGIASTNEEDVVVIKDNSILEINLDKPLKDYGGKYSFVDFDYNYADYTGLYTIIKAIQHAKTDNHIKGISIKNTNLINGGYAGLKNIRDVIEDFKSSGKFVYSYANGYNQKNYYLSSVADSVFLNPVGDVDFKGLASEVLFYKDLQEKTGVEMQVIRHGEYKSAVEPFLQNYMSDANREQLTELLSSLWKTITEDIAASRSIDITTLNTIADNLDARTPELALQNHIIDKAYYRDQYEGLLRKESDTPSDKELETVGIYEYARYAANKGFFKSSDNEIAVIFAQGEIIDGEGNNEAIGPELIINALRKARGNDNVKGIVLRVNSPGGSALASDIIWREIEITKLSKPVYVSMGHYAASGGYYISCGAEKIVAEPLTITGSIGVFGVVPNIKKLAENWGIHSEQVGTNKNSADYSVFKGLTDHERATIQEGIEDFYKTFVTKVAEGRGMTFDQVDQIARGRVWSGTDALNNGLIDELGGLNETIAMLAKDKGFEDYKIITYPEYENSIEEILSRFGLAKAKITESILEEEFGEEYQLLKKLKSLQTAKGIQAKLPYELNIE